MDAGDKAGRGFMGGFGKSLLGGAAVIGGAFAAVGVGQFLSGAITQASDLQETLSKSAVIFGDNAKEIEAFGNTAAKSLGLSKNQAIGAAAGFGDMFSQLGFGGKEAASLSKQVVQMSADLGSFNNLDTADVAERMSAAFRGEYDSLQTLIPNINAARVEQEALAATGKKSAKDLTAAEKAAATLAIVQKDGARAAGDFERTSGGLANQQKILAAQTADLQAKIGSALVPVLAKVAKFVNERVLPALADLGPIFAKVADVVGPFFRSLSDGSTTAGDAIGRYRATVGEVWGDVKSIFASAIGIVTTLWRTFGGSLVSYAQQAIGPILSMIRGMWDVIAGIFATVGALLKGDWSGVWDGIKQILSGAVTFLVGAVSLLWEQIKLAFSLAGTTLSAIFGGIWDGIKALTSSAIGFVVGQVQAIPGKLLGLLGSFSSAGKSLMQGFLDGLSQAGGFVKNFADGVWSAVKKLINGGIDKINGYLKIDIDTPGPGGISIDAGKIPHLAAGAYVDHPTLAVIGEAGPEVVLPLSSPHAPDWIANGPGTGGAGMTMNITVNPSAPLDERQLAEIVMGRIRFAAAGMGAF